MMAEGEKRPFIKLYCDLWDDKRLSCNERVVLISLLRHYNAERQRSWPSHETIASEVDRSRVVVWQTLKSLESKQFIRSEKQSGKTTLYELLFIDKPIQNPNTTYSEAEQVKEHPIQEFNTTYSDSKQVPIQNLNNTYSDSEHELDLRTRSIRTRSRELDKTPRARESAPAPRSAAKASDFDAEFEAFWTAYPKPKHPDKTPGRMRYEALRRKGVPAGDLLMAAENYAAAMRRDRTPPQYIKRCSTFLGPQEPWRDFVSRAPGVAQNETTDEEEFMRDALASGMISQQQYDEWRHKHGYR